MLSVLWGLKLLTDNSYLQIIKLNESGHENECTENLIYYECGPCESTCSSIGKSSIYYKSVNVTFQKFFQLSIIQNISGFFQKFTKKYYMNEKCCPENFIHCK